MLTCLVDQRGVVGRSAASGCGKPSATYSSCCQLMMWNTCGRRPLRYCLPSPRTIPSAKTGQLYMLNQRRLRQIQLSIEGEFFDSPKTLEFIDMGYHEQIKIWSKKIQIDRRVPYKIWLSEFSNYNSLHFTYNSDFLNDTFHLSYELTTYQNISAIFNRFLGPTINHSIYELRKFTRKLHKVN